MGKKMDIVSVWGVESNSAYDPGLPCWNNGNYPQPCGGVVMDVNGRDVIICVDDLSCGDFGDRIYIRIADSCHVWLAAYGTMTDASLDSDEELQGTGRSVSGCLDVTPDELRDAVRLAMDAIACVAGIDHERRMREWCQ